MHLFRTSWLLIACMGVIANASEVLEVDLVFPRNETYAPTKYFPVVFAFQNAERAKYLNPTIIYSTWDVADDSKYDTRDHDLRWVNWTSHDTYLAYNYFTLEDEGQWRIRWTLTWQSCDEEAFETHPFTAHMIHNSSTWSTWFTLRNNDSEVDLVAATDNKSCPDEYGMTINVTDKHMKVPSWVTWSGGDYTNDTCAVVASPTPTPAADPCRVHIDKTTVASMEASLHSRLCNGLNPPADCPDDKKNAAQQLAVAGVFCFLIRVGTLGFFLV